MIPADGADGPPRQPVPSEPHPPLRLPQRIRLSFSGSLAELTADELTDHGVVLSIDGAEQSHVEVDAPDYLLHDYLFRMGSVLQTCAHQRLSAATPRVLHLGAGALTLPRWIEHHWPHAQQTVVDIEPELVDFVLDHLPMRTAPHHVVADAAAVIRPGGALAAQTYDVVVVDLFNSAAAPPHLTAAEFHRDALARVAQGGLLLMNLGDEPGMAFARGQLAVLLDVLAEAESASAADAALLSAPADVLDGSSEGNLAYAVRRSAPLRQSELNAVWASGPHPCEVLSGEELRAWARPHPASGAQSESSARDSARCGGVPGSG